MVNQSIGKLMTREDHSFLRKNQNLVPGMTPNQSKAEYKRRFLEAMNQEPDPNKKANTGRRAANIWLRKQRDRE